MKKFVATKYEDAMIELATSQQLEELYKVIQDEENFVLEWKEGTVKRSKIIIGNKLSGKVETGDIELTAREAE